MKNKDLVMKLRGMDPEADVIIFYGPSDEWIRFPIVLILELSEKAEITLDAGPEAISRSDDWDELHPGF